MEKFKVIFVGAGAINFGIFRAPWNHSARLERYIFFVFLDISSLLGDRLRVLAIIDPDRTRSHNVLEEKRSGTARDAYCATELRPTITSYDGAAPDAVFIGTPPAFRGTTLQKRNIDVLASQKFPSAALFVEKPISSARIVDVRPLTTHFAETGTFVAVGYMLRYLKGKPEEEVEG
jgi:predicted dehydrogenase